MSEVKHAGFSPSRLAILEKCPWWISNGKSSDIAQRGTDFGAEIAAYALRKEVNITDEPTLDYGRQVIDEIEATHPDGQWQSEPILDTGIEEVWGYADLAKLDEWSDEAVLLELKTGYGNRGTAEHNIQVMSYVLGLLLKGYERVYAYLVEMDRKKRTSFVFTSQDIPTIQQRIESIKQKAQSATHQDAATGPQCKFCGKIETCKEVTLTTDTAIAVIKGANRGDLSPKEFAAVLSAGDLARTLHKVLPLYAIAEAYIGHLKSRAIELLSVGEEVPGFKLTERRGKRKWKDEYGAMDFLERAGFKLEQYIDIKSPAQVEKLGKEAKKLIAEFTEYGASTKSLEEIKE